MTPPPPWTFWFETRDAEAAPLLCAGIIGYRALRRASLPEGGRLGIYGFGASAHITAQIALALLSYHDTAGQFPRGAYTAASGTFDEDGLGWATKILPQIEEQTVYDRIQNNHPLRAGLGHVRRQDEHRGIRLRNFHLPVPAQPADLLLPATRVDPEEHGIGKVTGHILE